MNRKNSIQLKAAFLIIVLSLNTITGLACAVGIDMGFNEHHHDEEIETIHAFTDGKSHIHHEEADKHHHKSTGSKDDCCNGNVTKFSQLDKTVPQSLNIVAPIFFTAFISAFYNIDIPALSQSTQNIKYFVRRHHPPIPDIRIAIRSFQI